MRFAIMKDSQESLVSGTTFFEAHTEATGQKASEPSTFVILKAFVGCV